ncbi:MAG: GNAT family protein, partial [Myxococcota bacterium]
AARPQPLMRDIPDLPLLTPRLTLGPLTSDDAEVMFAYRGDRSVGRFQGWTPRSVKEVRQFIERQDIGNLHEPRAWTQLGLYLTTSGQLVGDLGIHTLDGPRQAELGITLSPARQGQGLATEAWRRALRYLLDECGRHRVIASVDPRNAAIVRLLERVGMRREAHFRQSLWFKEAWVDDVIYARLRDEGRRS